MNSRTSERFWIGSHGDYDQLLRDVQRYLKEQNFERVEVYCADESPRNNVGGWPVRVIRPGHTRRDFDRLADQPALGF